LSLLERRRIRRKHSQSATIKKLVT
jgi:hypothetical protein